MLEFEKNFVLTIIVIFFLQNGSNLKKRRNKKIQTIDVNLFTFLKNFLSPLQKGADSRMIMTHHQMKLCFREVRKIFY